MKKIFSAGLALLLCAASLAGCSANEPDASSESGLEESGQPAAETETVSESARSSRQEISAPAEEVDGYL